MIGGRARALRGVLMLVALLSVVLLATPTLGAFSGTISATGSTTASSLVLSSAPSGAGTCISTGATGQFASDSAICSGSMWSATQLSGVAGSPQSLTTTLSSVGGSNPSSASVASGSPGLEATPDDSGNGDDAFAAGSVRFGASGPLAGSAASFDGSTGMLETEQAFDNPGPSYSLAGWFKVANGYGSGGGIIGFQGIQRGTPSSDWDRKLWMDNSGQVSAGEYNGTANQIASSTKSYNDGSWICGGVVQRDHGADAVR